MFSTTRLIDVVELFRLFSRRKRGRIRSQSNYILHAIDESKYATAAAGSRPSDNSNNTDDVYADRCTLLLHREPFRCHTISRDCNIATTKDCARQLRRSQSTHSAGNIVDGVIITALPSASSNLAHASTTSAILDADQQQQTTLLLQNRDKSLDYKWDSMSLHADTSSNEGGLTDIDAAGRSSNNCQSSNTVSSQTSAPFLVGIGGRPHRADEPYYFKYDPKRPRVQFSDRTRDDELKPDVVSNCSTFRVARQS